MSIRARITSLALVTLAGLGAVAVAGGAIAPTVADPYPTTEPTPVAQPELTDFNYISWLGEGTTSYVYPDTGETGSYSLEGIVVTYRCDGVDCVLYATTGEGLTYPSLGTGWILTQPSPTPLRFASDGTWSADFPQRGDLCADSSTYVAQMHVELSATATSFTSTNTSSEPRIDCTDRPTWFSPVDATRTVTAVYLEGNPCVLDGGECDPGAVAADLALPAATDDLAARDAADAASAARVTTSQIASGQAAAASVLTTLPTIQDAPMGVLDVCVAVLVTIILSLLVAFPKKLYASALGALPGRWAEHKEWASGLSHPAGRWWHGVLSRPARPPAARADVDDAEAAADEADAEAAIAEEARHGIGSAPWRRAAFGVVAAGVISAFVDPGFGLNPGSARVAVSLSASFLLNVVVGWSVAIWIARRFTPGLAASYQFKPWTLAVVALTVVFTRVTGMQPGMVFGLVAGVALGAMASKAVEARVAVAQTAYAFALGLVGWGAYSLLAPAWGDTGNFLLRLLIDTLAGLSIAGFAAAPLALLPIAGMGGAKVYEWSKRAWFAMYTVGLLGFFVVLMPMSYSWKEVSIPLAAWLTLYVAYAGVAVVLYAALVRPWRSASADEVDAEGVEGDAGEDTGDAAGPEDDRAKEQAR